MKPSEIDTDYDCAPTGNDINHFPSEMKSFADDLIEKAEAKRAENKNQNKTELEDQ